MTLPHPTRPLRSKNRFSYCRSMFGWFGEVGGHRKNHTHRCALSFSYLDKRNVKKPPKSFFDFLTLVICHRFFFFARHRSLSRITKGQWESKNCLENWQDRSAYSLELALQPQPQRTGQRRPKTKSCQCVKGCRHRIGN